MMPPNMSGACSRTSIGLSARVTLHLGTMRPHERNRARAPGATARGDARRDASTFADAVSGGGPGSRRSKYRAAGGLLLQKQREVAAALQGAQVHTADAPPAGCWGVCGRDVRDAIRS